MSKQARAMALLVLENDALLDDVVKAKEERDAAVRRAHGLREQLENDRAELKAAGINYDRTIKERDALAAELRAGREGNQHYAGELRTFFEGVRALIGAEEMKDDCSSVLQELGRHTSDSLHKSARAVLDVLRAEYAGDPDKDPALRWLTLGHKLYPWFEAGFPGTSSEVPCTTGTVAKPDPATALVTPRPTGTAPAPGPQYFSLFEIPGVKGLHTSPQFWTLRLSENAGLSEVAPLLNAVLKQHPELPQFWESNNDIDPCFYGRDPGPNEEPGVYV